MSKYGIFKATICVERPPLKMLDIIENDYYIGKPLEVFDTAEQAVSKMNEEYFQVLKKYTNIHEVTFTIAPLTL